MIDTRKIKKLLILNIPYIIVGLIATNIGEAWRMAEGADNSAKLLSLFSTLSVAFGNPLPSFYPLDLLIGIVCGASLRLAVYLRGKNAKKYRHNVEYGSARWGTAKDIEPFMAPKFEDNVILTKTERLMMSNRPKNPANARNKNVLIVSSNGVIRFAPYITGDFAAFAKEHDIKVGTGCVCVFEKEGNNPWKCIEWNVKPAKELAK